MSLLELFTNKEKTENEEVEVSAPAFSITKVTAGLGVVVGGLLVAIPEAIRDDVPVVIAVVAAATVIMLGILALVAVDIRTRQHAQEAKRRWPLASDAKEGDGAQQPAAGTLLVKVVGGEDGNSSDDSAAASSATPAASSGKSAARIIDLEPGQTASVVISNSKR